MYYMRWRSECLKKNGGCPDDISFSLPCCKLMNLLETYIDYMQERVECDYCVSGKKRAVRVSKGQRSCCFHVYSNTQIALSELNMWHLIAWAMHSNILQGRENGFLSRLFMAKILYSFLYNKTSITVWVNGVGRWGRQSAAQCNNNCASALNEPRKRAGSCRY